MSVPDSDPDRFHIDSLENVLEVEPPKIESRTKTSKGFDTIRI